MITWIRTPNKYTVPFLIVLCTLFTTPNSFGDNNEAELLYQQHCSTCHGLNRLGGVGPALLPQNLRRLKQDAAAEVISNGAAATQMPAFKSKLAPSDISSLVELIYRPLEFVPQWSLDEIQSSHLRHYPEQQDVQPVYTSDPLNLFVVVESGDHHATILDGDTFAPIHRFKTRHALHGGPKFSSDGRYVYFASRDGWISKFDMYLLQTVVEVRAGINTRNIAVSSDNRYVIVGNYLPHTLVLLDAVDLSVIKVIPVDDGVGNSSRVSAVYDAPPRQSFIAALKDLTEVWEIFYDNTSPEQHGARDEALYDASRFRIRRIPLDD